MYDSYWSVASCKHFQTRKSLQKSCDFQLSRFLMSHQYMLSVIDQLHSQSLRLDNDRKPARGLCSTLILTILYLNPNLQLLTQSRNIDSLFLCWCGAKGQVVVTDGCQLSGQRLGNGKDARKNIGKHSVILWWWRFCGAGLFTFLPFLELWAFP